jgi:hypothetical protein
MAITIVIGREADVLGDTFRKTALERFRVLACMFSLISQREYHTSDKGLRYILLIREVLGYEYFADATRR